MLFISVVPDTQFLNHFSRSRPCSSLCPLSAPHRKCIIVTAQMASPQQLCRGSAGKLRECSHICIWFFRETRGHRVEVSQGNISNRGKKGKNWKNILRGFHWLAGKKDPSVKMSASGKRDNKYSWVKQSVCSHSHRTLLGPFLKVWERSLSCWREQGRSRGLEGLRTNPAHLSALRPIPVILWNETVMRHCDT